MKTDPIEVVELAWHTGRSRGYRGLFEVSISKSSLTFNKVPHCNVFIVRDGASADSSEG